MGHIHGTVDPRGHASRQIEASHVGRNSYDRVPGSLVDEPQLPANRIPPGQKRLAVALVTITTAGPAGEIGWSEPASGLDADVHHPEIVRGHGMHPEQRSRLSLRHGVAGQHHGSLGDGACQRQRVDERCSANTGCGLHLAFELAIEGQAAVRSSAD